MHELVPAADAEAWATETIGDEQAVHAVHLERAVVSRFQRKHRAERRERDDENEKGEERLERVGRNAAQTAEGISFRGIHRACESTPLLWQCSAGNLSDNCRGR
jgi:hypothetical protein